MRIIFWMEIESLDLMSFHAVIFIGKTTGDRMFLTRLAVADMLDIPFQVQIGKRKAWIWRCKKQRS